MSLEVLLLVDNQLWGGKEWWRGRRREGGGGNSSLTLNALAPGCCCLDAGFWWSVAIVKGSAKKKLKQTREAENQSSETSKPQTNTDVLQPLTSPVCASVVAMAPPPQYIRDARGGSCQRARGCPHPRGHQTLLQSYFISCQFCPAGLCSISTRFSTTRAKRAAPPPGTGGRRLPPCRPTATFSLLDTPTAPAAAHWRVYSRKRAFQTPPGWRRRSPEA